MFHHRSCGTTALVALMAAHRAAHGQEEGLRQQDITRMTEALLATPAPVEFWHREAEDRPALRN